MTLSHLQHGIAIVLQAAVLTHYRKEAAMHGHTLAFVVAVVIVVALVVLWRKGYIKKWTVGPR